MNENDISLVEEVVLREWDIRVKRKIKPLGNAFKIVSDRGSKVLKKAKLGKQQMTFVVKVLEDLTKKGFRNCCRFIYTKYGDPFVYVNDEVYFLTDFVEGSTVNFGKIDQFKEAVNLLANFHNLSEKLNVNKDSSLRLKHDLSEMFSDRLGDLQQWARSLDQIQYRTSVDTMYMGKASTFYAKGLKALYFLQKVGYSEQLKADIGKGTLIHRNYISKNLLKTKTEQIFVLDFDRCTVGSGVHDLARVLDRYLPKYEWDNQIIDSLLNEYSSVRELSEREKAIIYGYLMFPNHLYRVAARYFRTETDISRLPKWEDKMKEIILEHQVKELKLTEWVNKNNFNWNLEI